jgi:hypothetical protein
MALGGVAPGNEAVLCPELTCNIPDPATPGWVLGKDAMGCAKWTVPSGPIACGAPPLPPIEAGPPCAPASVSGYTPAPLVPPNPPTPTACTAAELTQFYGLCIAQDVESEVCLGFQATDATCAQCLLSQGTDASWGAVVVSGGKAKLNVPGCIALVQQDSSASSCAQRVSDEMGCVGAACDAVCPVTVDAGSSAYEACVESAAATECRSYVDQECDPAEAGVTACVGKTSDEASFAALAAVFCGGS